VGVRSLCLLAFEDPEPNCLLLPQRDPRLSLQESSGLGRAHILPRLLRFVSHVSVL
jgi:hypothetical protein